MPHYAKCMKDILSKKRNFDEEGVVTVNNLQFNNSEELATENVRSM